MKRARGRKLQDQGNSGLRVKYHEGIRNRNTRTSRAAWLGGKYHQRREHPRKAQGEEGRAGAPAFHWARKHHQDFQDTAPGRQSSASRVKPGAEKHEFERKLIYLGSDPGGSDPKLQIIEGTAYIRKEIPGKTTTYGKNGVWPGGTGGILSKGKRGRSQTRHFSPPHPPL